MPYCSNQSDDRVDDSVGDLLEFRVGLRISFSSAEFVSVAAIERQGSFMGDRQREGHLFLWIVEGPWR